MDKGERVHLRSISNEKYCRNETFLLFIRKESERFLEKGCIPMI
ncbi:hypothetical protein KIS1582_0214 [Cytobacillus firmus]|uniref:Uncharacterized protein n=1 Tax=Cytobacillus firmus TaxID=1399 RepID=A0A800NGM0_CYTFI|nr:hypothetical protein KIS1582_0214 [Cytobacillus firmus]